MARCTEIHYIHAEELQDLLRWWPEVQDIAGSANFVVALEEFDLEPCLMTCQSSGHAAGTGSDDADPTPSHAVIRHIDAIAPVMNWLEVMPASSCLYNRFARCEPSSGSVIDVRRTATQANPPVTASRGGSPVPESLIHLNRAPDRPLCNVHFES